MPFKHGTPPEQMAAWLRDARARGESFDEAWAAALRAPSVRGAGIYVPHRTEDRAAWIEAFDSTREEWRAAYEHRSSVLSVRLRRLSSACEDASRPAERVLVAAA